MFCNVYDFRVLHKSVTLFMFYKSPFYEFTIPFFVNRGLQHSTLYEPTFCTVHFRVTTFFVYTLRHNPCFGHKVHVLQRPRFLSSFFISLCYIVFVLQIHILRILCQSDSSTLNVLRVYVCTIHFLKTTFCDSTLQTCSYKSVLQLYSLNIYVLPSPFFVLQVQRFYEFLFYDCYPDNVYHSPCFAVYHLLIHVYHVLHMQFRFCTVNVLHCRRFTSRIYSGGAGGVGCAPP